MSASHWHSLTVDETLKQLASTRSGLTEEEVSERRKRHGRNALPKKPPLPWVAIFVRQFKGAFVYILLAATAISFALSEIVDGFIILAAVTINVVVGFIQEYRAQRSLERLREVIQVAANVIRDGQEHEISIDEVVPGDVIVVQNGSKVPADARLIEGRELTVNEAPLTGESYSVEKDAKKLPEDKSLGDRVNMLYLGTTVLTGTGKAVVVGTGRETEIGRIAKMLEETKEDETPLQKRIERFSKILAALVLGIAFTIFFIGLLTERPLGEMFTLAVALAVAAIPEGLVVIVTVILTIGMKRILKRGSLVRNLLAAETLGSTSVICTDKTGSLTEGNMRVSHIVSAHGELVSDNKVIEGKIADQDTLMHAVRIGVVCNDAFVENEQEGAELEHLEIRGSFTERALLHFGSELGIAKGKTDKTYPRVDAIPFDSKRKYMATLNRSPEKRNYVFVKGSPEAVLSRSSSVAERGGTKRLTEAKRKELESLEQQLSRRGLRILALAYKPVTVAERSFAKKTNLTEDLIFVAFVGIKDPLREGTKETIAMVKQAGVRTVMITGDHKLTAQTIADELGIPAKAENIMEGKELAELNDHDLANRVQDVSVYARVTPEDKLRIVDALQSRGEVVAMTGDGVNDAPALKSADIGVALGSGTDVTKEVAGIVLLDNQYNTLVAAVREGRVIFDNIRKVLLYLMSDAFTEVLLIVGAIIASIFLQGFPIPLLAAQILWVNLISDGLGGVAMTLEPGEARIMDEKPRSIKEPIMNRQLTVIISTVSVVTGIFYLGLFAILYYQTLDVDWARTVIFAAVATDSLFYVFSIRSLRRSFIRMNPFSNPWLIAAIIASFGLILVSIYVPAVQNVLHTTPLGWVGWGIVFASSIFVLFVAEFAKWLSMKRDRPRVHARSHV